MSKNKKQGFFGRLKTAATVGTKYVFRGYDAVHNTRNRAKRGTDAIRSEEVELSGHNRDRIISAAIEMRRNNPVVASISRLRKGDVIGRGIVPQANTGDTALDRQIDEGWLEYMENPEISGQMDMREVQQQMVDALFFYGDSGLVLTNDSLSRVQFIDGSRIGNPGGNFTGSESNPWQTGVMVDGMGVPVRYAIGRRVNGVLTNIEEVDARNFIPFFRPIRPNQYRGTPEISPILNIIQDIGEYDSVEMVSAKAAAAMSVFIKRQNANVFADALLDDEAAPDDDRRLQQVEPGSIQYLEPDEEAQVISTNNRPNVDGVQWVQYLLRKVGSSLGIPLEFLLMEIGGSSFSASQGVVLQYQQTVESYQNDVIKAMRRWHRWWLTRKYAEGVYKMPSGNDVRPFRVRWQRPAFRWINRAQQVQADMRYFALGAMSLDDIVAPFGYTAEDVLVRKAQNIERAKQVAIDHGMEGPDAWRELINPFTTSISLSGAPLEGDVQNKADDDD